MAEEIWKPDLGHLDSTSNKPDKIWKPDFGSNSGATSSTDEAGKEETLKPALPGGRPSSTASGNSQGSTKPTNSTNPTPGSTQGPTSSNANTNTPSSTKPVTTNPNSSSVNGSDPTAANGSLNNSKPANGTGDAAGGGGVSTDSAGGSSTTQPGSNRPTAGGAQPIPQPTTTLEKPTGGQTPSGGTLANADPWNASCGTADNKGLVQSPARGGSAGTVFSDAGCVTSPQTTNITAVKINSNTGIDRIQVCYGGKWAEAHGGKAGLQGLSEETFYLQRGEVIVQIEGRSGTRLDSLQFTTSTGRKSKVYGGTGGYSFSWSGQKLVYISGRSGDQVDSLQSYWVV